MCNMSVCVCVMLRRIVIRYCSYCTQETHQVGDEIANVNFLYNDIVHVLQNTIDSCINSAIDRRGYYGRPQAGAKGCTCTPWILSSNFWHHHNFF